MKRKTVESTQQLNTLSANSAIVSAYRCLLREVPGESGHD